MRTSTKIAAALFVLGTFAGLMQLWFTPWSPALFIKIEMTLGAILVVVLVLGFLVSESEESKALRRGDRSD